MQVLSLELLVVAPQWVPCRPCRLPLVSLQANPERPVHAGKGLELFVG
jgi:hypothetical protein